jgi:hypothetical protein
MSVPVTARMSVCMVALMLMSMIVVVVVVVVVPTVIVSLHRPHLT